MPTGISTDFILPFVCCPKCRTVEDGEVTCSLLRPSAGDESPNDLWLRPPLDRCVEERGKGHHCLDCGAYYPTIGGVICIPPDVQAHLEAQSDAVLSKWWTTAKGRAEMGAILAALDQSDPAGSFFDEAKLSSVYAAAHYFDNPGLLPLGIEDLSRNRQLFALVGRLLRKNPLPAAGVGGSGVALEVGCGPGGLLPVLASHAPHGVVGFDLRLSMLSIAHSLMSGDGVVLPYPVEGKRFVPVTMPPQGGHPVSTQMALVQGDIAAPPFVASSFSLVASMCLLDTVPQPFVALGQMDALLQTQGLLLIGCPYQWTPRIVSPDGWWSDNERLGSQTLRMILDGKHPALPHLKYEILAQADRIPWVIPANSRLTNHYYLDVVLARKLNP